MMPAKQDNIEKERLSLFEKFIEVFGWLQIVASPLLLAGIIGFLIYISNPNSNNLIISIAITTVGLVIGIIWATRVWKRKGTIEYMSRIMATPDLDNINEEKSHRFK